MNPATLARQTDVPLVAWTARGGIPVTFGLHHNSMATRSNAALGGKWLHTYDVRLVLSNGGMDADIEWAHLTQGFTKTGPVWTNTDGYRDRLVPSAGSFLLTSKERIEFAFEATPDPTVHRLRTIRDTSGNTVTLFYDGSGRLTRVQDPNAREVLLAYEPTSGKLSSVRFVASGYVRRWSFWYHLTSGRLNAVNSLPPSTQLGGGNPKRSIKFVTDPATDNLTSLTDFAGAVWQFGYVGNAASYLQYPGNTSSERVTYTDSMIGNTVTDPMGVDLTYEHDGSGRLVEVVDALGNATTLAYGDADYGWAPSQVQNAEGDVAAYDWDVRGNAVGITPPGLGRFDLVYDVNDRLIRVRQPLVTDADGVMESTRHRTDYVYDALSRLVAVRRFTDATNFVERSFTYSPQGLVVAATNELDQTTSYGYDGYGNLTSLTSPEGRVFTWDFTDPISTVGFRLPRSMQIAGGALTTYEYDLWGRLRERIQADASGAKYRYDPRDQPVWMEDATGVTTWTYDARGWLRSMTTDGGAWTAAITRDPAGRVSTITETGSFGQEVISHSYDAAGRLASKTDGTTTTYGYDAASRLVQIARANGVTTSRTFTNGLLQGVAHGSLASFGFDYQTNGLLMRKTELDGHQTEFFHDFLDRIVLEDRTGPVDTYTIVHGYDAADRRVSRQTNGVLTTFSHDADGLVQTLNDQAAGQSVYSWDPAARLVSIQDPTQLRQFGWDDAGRLTTCIGASGQDGFSYDGLSQRVARIAADPNGLPWFDFLYRHFPSYGTDDISGPWLLRREERSDGVSTAQGVVRFGPAGLESFDDIDPFFIARERFPISDETGTRALTNAAGTLVPFDALYDFVGRTLLHTGENPAYQWGSDAGSRTEGATGLIYTSSGWYEPESGARIGPVDPDWNELAGANAWPDDWSMPWLKGSSITTLPGWPVEWVWFTVGDIGRVVDQADLAMLLTADLANGNTLSNGNTLLRPSTNQRLANGNTLVGFQDRALGLLGTWGGWFPNT